MVCNTCGTTTDSTETTPKKKKGKLAIILWAIIAVVFIGLVALLGSDNDESSLTVPAENDTGALINMTFQEYSENFGKTLDEFYLVNNLSATNFDLSLFWNNKVEPITEYEDNSGKAFTTYFAFLDGTHISVKEQDEKINSINICFDYDENDFAIVSAAITYMMCGKMEFEEANKIFETVRDGIMSNTMVYKDGILYSITTSTVSYTIMAASEEFISSLEASGSCNVLRW